MKNYIDLVAKILQKGEDRMDRTGVGTRSIFGHQLEFDLRDRFPLVTAKETRWKVAFLEMLWFLRGESNTEWLHKHGCRLWDAWADKNGELGPIYGFQWREWRDGRTEVDQIKNLIDELKNNPQSRRHIVTAWNVADIPFMALPPCHWAHQCYVSNSGFLDLKLFLRSSDVALGLPFNICQYALLTHLYARAAGLLPRRLIVDIGDAHLYQNHIEAMCKVVAEGPVYGDRATLLIHTSNTDIDGYKPDDFEIMGYQPNAFVKLEVAV